MKAPELVKMVKGDKFSCGTLLDGMTQEQVEWEVIAREDSGKTGVVLTMIARFCGVLLGSYKAKCSGNTVTLGRV